MSPERKMAVLKGTMDKINGMYLEWMNMDDQEYKDILGDQHSAIADLMKVWQRLANRRGQLSLELDPQLE